MTDKNGVAAAKYSYDAWGVCTIISDISDCGIAQINPYRYRSYYYDSEIGMYYLQSRYYDPAVGRFINADEASIISLFPTKSCINGYSHCFNSPIKFSDYSGYLPRETARDLIKQNKRTIISAAKYFSIKPVTLAATIYAELIENVNVFDSLDYVAFEMLQMNTSIGIAQVKISAAIGTEDAGYMPVTKPIYYYNSFGHYFIYDRKRPVAQKLLNDSLNIQYAAAYLAWICDLWKGVYPGICGDTAVMATLYNMGEHGKEGVGIHPNPQPNDFGRFARSQLLHMEYLLDYHC